MGSRDFLLDHPFRTYQDQMPQNVRGDCQGNHGTSDVGGARRGLRKLKCGRREKRHPTGMHCLTSTSRTLACTATKIKLRTNGLRASGSSASYSKGIREKATAFIQDFIYACALVPVHRQRSSSAHGERLWFHLCADATSETSRRAIHQTRLQLGRPESVM